MSQLATGIFSMVVGTDPGGSEPLRVGGSMVIPNGQFYSAKRTSGGITIPILGFASGTDRIVLGHVASLPPVNIASSAVTVGTDPGGSELLRVGGMVRSSAFIATSQSTLAGITVSGGGFAAGSLYKDPNYGLVLGASIGAIDDFSLFNPTAGTQIIHVPTGTVRVGFASGIGVFGTAPLSAKPNVSGSRGGNAALASLLTALVSYGFLTDGTT